MKFSYYYIENFYSLAEIKELQDLIDKIENENFYDEPADGVTKTSTVKIYNHGQLWNQLDKFRHMVHNLNRLYFGFDLFEVSKYDVVHYNEYSSDNNGEYGWHSDGCRDECRDIKLTALLNLSDKPYEGGDLTFFLNHEDPILNFRSTGSLIVFPSWTQHKVTPVSAGLRKTITCFFCGPNWK